MHQYFYAIGVAVGEQISEMRLRRTEHRYDPCQRGADAHVHGLGGELDGIDVDYCVSPRTNRAHPSVSMTGHFTVSAFYPKGISMLTDASG